MRVGGFQSCLCNQAYGALSGAEIRALTSGALPQQETPSDGDGEVEPDGGGPNGADIDTRLRAACGI